MYNNSGYVEEKIRYNIIPTTRIVGIVSGILAGLSLCLAHQIIMGIVTTILYVSFVFALVILLEGFAEIITLLRKISKNNSNTATNSRDNSNPTNSDDSINIANVGSGDDPALANLLSNLVKK